MTHVEDDEAVQELLKHMDRAEALNARFQAGETLTPDEQSVLYWWGAWLTAADDADEAEAACARMMEGYGVPSAPIGDA